MSIETRAARYVIDMDDPDITSARRIRIERWLAKDERHREAYRTLRATNRYVERVFRRGRDSSKPS